MSAVDTVGNDERQPLLPPTVLVNDQEVHDEENPSNLARNDDDEEPKRKRSWWSIFWYTLLAALGVFYAVLFIKGFIEARDVNFDLKKALWEALGGGLSGAAAMVLQVLTLMPIRTVMNYQYRYGTTMTEAAKTLYADGGWTRYYQGLAAALIQGPVARFGDTAANTGVLALLRSNSYMKKLPSLVQTVAASLAAAAFRMILTPVDTVKTTMQTDGKAGLAILRGRIKRYGIGTLWYGAFATAAATFVGHYPWFGTYNFLSDHIPKPGDIGGQLLRQAFIGFCASVISDTVSNSLRVVKTYRQVHERRVGYMEAAEAVIATDGLRGLFGRGLKTRILANGLQGIMFSILWKLFLQIWDDNTSK